MTRRQAVIRLEDEVSKIGVESREERCTIEPGDVVDVVIEGLGFSGEGYVSPAPGRFISVPHTLLGDRLLVRVGSWRRGRAWAEIFERCSGCSLRHMSRAAERAFKEMSIREMLGRYAGDALGAGLDATGELPVAWIGEVGRDGHRVRGRFSVQVANAEVRIGLGGVALSRDVVDIRRCPAQAPRFVEIVEHVGRHLDERPSVAAGLESLDVCIGAGESALVQVAGTPEATALVSSSLDSLTDARLVVNPSDAGLVLDNGVVAPVGSWVPVNPAAATLMVQWVISALGRRRHCFVLDLCSGLGTVTRELARHYRVLAVDRDHRATRALSEANFPNVVVRTGAVGRILRKLRRELGPDLPTAAVVNPMRRPLGAQLDDLRPLGIEQIIYLGPAPASACRDAQRLAQVGGYRICEVAAVDLHPGTSQVMLALNLKLDPNVRRGHP